MRENRPSNGKGRFWRLMRVVAGVAALSVVLALAFLRGAGSPMPIQAAAAVALGIGLSILLAGVLMGLVFLSDSSGHDAAVGRDDEEDER